MVGQDVMERDTKAWLHYQASNRPYCLQVTLEEKTIMDEPIEATAAEVLRQANLQQVNPQHVNPQHVNPQQGHSPGMPQQPGMNPPQMRNPLEVRQSAPTPPTLGLDLSAQRMYLQYPDQTLIEQPPDALYSTRVPPQIETQMDDLDIPPWVFGRLNNLSPPVQQMQGKKWFHLKELVTADYGIVSSNMMIVLDYQFQHYQAIVEQWRVYNERQASILAAEGRD